MTIRAILAVLTATATAPLFAAPQQQAVSSPCPELEPSNLPELVEYLKQDRAALKEACIVYAVGKLGVRRYAPAVAILVKYLDFRGPDDPQRAKYGVMQHSYWPIFPAENALFLIGKPAIPDLISVIAASGTPDRIRKSATSTLGSILREEPSRAVATLVRASRAEKDPDASMRLLDAAKEAATDCAPAIRSGCVNALYEQ